MLFFCVNAELDLVLIRTLFFSNQFLYDSFLLCKTFRSVKGGMKWCSVCMITCVTYSFLSGVQVVCTIGLVFQFAVCWWFFYEYVVFGQRMLDHLVEALWWHPIGLIVANHELITFIRFVSRIGIHICKIFCN